ncbi:ATPase V [Burkholderia ubonensis]|uniref:FliH/SctL family protein n=1 Tax=Burkholderia ubonensis TaxID=101571 RepID=UPI00075B8894|nr:FliH/SctL family protein [Burkholderia ubonensis]KVD55013.1 ATPase V [Burkholderia ubonensis]
MHFRVMRGASGELDALSESRVVKADAIAELFDAIDLRASLKAELAQAKLDRQEAVNDARREGYAQGEREARYVVSECVQNAQRFLARAHSTFEAQFARFVAMAVEQIVEPLPDPMQMRAVIRHAYAAFGDEIALRVVVHPDDRDAAQSALEQYRPEWRAILTDDALIPRGGCRLESMLVVVELEWDTLLKGIEQATLNAFRDAAPLAKDDT